jgi:hypothetical protein
LQEGRLDRARAALAEAVGFGAEHPADAEPAPLIGSARCGSCHAEIARRMRASRHARSFARGSDLPAPLPDHPVADPGDATVMHTLTRAQDAVRVEARAGDRVASALVEFAFGSGHRAVTLVVRDEAGTIREYRLTRYARGVGWDVTIGQPNRPRSPAEDLGRPLTADRIRGCLHCHATHFRAAGDRAGPEASDPGIGCERCHGPGGHHLRAIEAGFPDPAIGRPGLAPAERVTALCADCHSPFETLIVPDDPASVRFQGKTLTWSRCYTESQGGLDCTTCHDPHRDAETAPSHYEAICLDCHGGQESADAGRGAWPSCPVNPSADCLRCHMPSVPEAVPHTAYTDHHIRVHRPR